MTPSTRSDDSPTAMTSPTPMPSRPISWGSIQTAPGGGPAMARLPACAFGSCSNNSPRKGYEESTALSDTSLMPPCVLTMDDMTRYDDSSRPSAAAWSSTWRATGSSADKARSPPSNCAELRSNALDTLSDRNPTLLTAAAQISRESASKPSSPERQSRFSARKPGARYLFQSVVIGVGSSSQPIDGRVDAIDRPYLEALDGL